MNEDIPGIHERVDALMGQRPNVEVLLESITVDQLRKVTKERVGLASAKGVLKQMSHDLYDLLDAFSSYHDPMASEEAAFKRIQSLAGHFILKIEDMLAPLLGVRGDGQQVFSELEARIVYLDLGFLPDSLACEGFDSRLLNYQAAVVECLEFIVRLLKPRALSVKKWENQEVSFDSNLVDLWNLLEEYGTQALCESFWDAFSWQIDYCRQTMSAADVAAFHSMKAILLPYASEEDIVTPKSKLVLSMNDFDEYLNR